MKQLLVHVPEDLLKKLKILCAEHEVTMRSVVILALEAAIKSIEKNGLTKQEFKGDFDMEQFS